MKSAQNRLNNLEADLTPKQLVMKFVAEMMAFDNLNQFVEYAAGDEFFAEQEKMRENKDKAARKRANSKDEMVLNRACRTAHREFVFLLEMAMYSCRQMETDKFRYLFFVSTLAHLLGRIWQLSGETSGVDRQVKLMEKINRMVDKFFPELLGNLLLAKEISRKYFNDRPLLFNDQQARVEELVELVEDMIEGYNEAVELLELPRPDLQIDVAALHTLAEQRVPLLVERAENEARVAIYASEGRHLEAMKLLRG